jgi:hypothetical protein
MGTGWAMGSMSFSVGVRFGSTGLLEYDMSCLKCNFVTIFLFGGIIFD